MRKNIKKYYQAWELKQQGKKLREIAKILGYKSVEWPRVMINHIESKIKYRRPISKELKNLIIKYRNNIKIKTKGND
jgi:hypothetical protein